MCVISDTSRVIFNKCVLKISLANLYIQTCYVCLNTFISSQYAAAIPWWTLLGGHVFFIRIHAYKNCPWLSPAPFYSFTVSSDQLQNAITKQISAHHEPDGTFLNDKWSSYGTVLRHTGYRYISNQADQSWSRGLLRQINPEQRSQLWCINKDNFLS